MRLRQGFSIKIGDFSLFHSVSTPFSTFNPQFCSISLLHKTIYVDFVNKFSTICG